MASHRRRPVGWLVTGRRYRELEARYRDLTERYRALEADHDFVLEDHEGLLYDLEQRQLPAPPASEDETQPLPAVSGPAMDPAGASALTRRAGLLEGPSGAWKRQSPGTTG